MDSQFVLTTWNATWLLEECGVRNSDALAQRLLGQYALGLITFSELCVRLNEIGDK